MRWTPPSSEKQWQELLSERLDRELDPETSQALDDYLRTHGDRAKQLEDLRQTSGLLRQWSVEVPQSAADFLERIEAEERPTQKQGQVIALDHRRILTSRFSPLLRYAAVFILGILSGGVFVKQISQPLPSQPEVVSTRSVERPDLQEDASPISEPSIGAISPRQAEQLFLASEAQFREKGERAGWQDLLAANGLSPDEIRARAQKSGYAGSERLLRRFRHQLEEPHRRTEL